MEENIGYLKITMDDIIISQIFQPLENIQYIWLSFGLCEVMAAAEFAFQIAAVTNFCYYIAIAIATEYLVAFKDVGVR